MTVRATRNTQSVCVTTSLDSYQPTRKWNVHSKKEDGLKQDFQNNYNHTLKINKHSTMLTQV